MKKVLMGFVNDRAVWYKPFDCLMYCPALNLLYTGIHNFNEAAEKCKIFKNFEYAINAELKYNEIMK